MKCKLPHVLHHTSDQPILSRPLHWKLSWLDPRHSRRPNEDRTKSTNLLARRQHQEPNDHCNNSINLPAWRFHLPLPCSLTCSFSTLANFGTYLLFFLSSISTFSFLFFLFFPVIPYFYFSFFALLLPSALTPDNDFKHLHCIPIQYTT